MATDHELQRQLSYWKDILARVADDMAPTATRDVDPQVKRWFESRSRRIRELLGEPVPPGWSAMTSTIGRRR